MSDRITLSEAIKFHGHLGPYLILGILAGELALRRMGYKKYFDLEIKVWGANRKPKSCLIDGLQLSTGATYGKGNIHKLDGRKIKIEFFNSHNNKKFIRSRTENLEPSQARDELRGRFSINRDRLRPKGQSSRRLILRFRESLIQRLEETKIHRDSELLAKKLYKIDSHKLFNLQLIPRHINSG